MRSCSFPRVLSLIACAGVACGAFANNSAPRSIRADYPGVIVQEWQGRAIAFGGVPMTSAATAQGAVTAWLQSYAGEFGVGNLDLRVNRVTDLETAKTVYVFDQYIGGLPVEYGTLRLIVLHTGQAGDAAHQVVLATAKLARVGDAGLAAPMLSAEEATARVQKIARFADLGEWSAPEQVVFFGEGDFAAWADATTAWKFSARSPDRANPRRFTFFVDAATGKVLTARNEVHEVNITGTVQGLATPGTAADHSGNPPVVTGIPQIEVRVQGTSTAVFTDDLGNFTIPWPGTAPVTLETRVRQNGGAGANEGSGRWVEVIQSPDALAPAAEIAVTQAATPGTPVTIDINPASSEYTNAQVNAFIHQTRTHNYFRQWAPAFTALDDHLPAYVMINASCNAYYDGVSTNFYNMAGTCNNTAFSSVVAHEYGHHIVNQLGLAQGGFGEGFADTISMLEYDDAVVGRFFGTNGGAVRDPDNTNRQYPTNNTEVHAAGEVLGGMLWEVRKNFGTRYGNPAGLNMVRQLHANWAQITIGGLAPESCHPTTELEWLTLDDTDGNLYNGTPNLPQISAAFQAHNICFPELRARTTLVSPSTVPQLVAPFTPLTVTMNVLPGVASATNTPTTISAAPMLMYRTLPSGTFTSVPMTQSPPGFYNATVPGQSCTTRMEWKVQVTTSAGTFALPGSGACNATVDGYKFLVAGAIADTFADNFDAQDPGWTVGTDIATTGNWTFGDPLATAAQPATGSDGINPNCWFTGQGTAGGAVGEADVDGGQTILTSPAFNMVGLVGPRFAYKRWYSNTAGAAPAADVFTIQVSSDNGATWVNGEVVGPTTQNTGGWLPGEVWLSDIGVSPSPQMRIRFIAEDAGAGSIIEAAVDAFRISGLACGGTACDTIDFNHDGLFPDTQDIDDFLSVFSGGPCSTGTCGDIDFNNDGLFPDTQDIDSLLSVFSGGPCI